MWSLDNHLQPSKILEIKEEIWHIDNNFNKFQMLTGKTTYFQTKHTFSDRNIQNKIAIILVEMRFFIKPLKMQFFREINSPKLLIHLLINNMQWQWIMMYYPRSYYHKKHRNYLQYMISKIYTLVCRVHYNMKNIEIKIIDKFNKIYLV